MEQTKKCTKCGETKDLSSFRKDKRGKHGICPRCKYCEDARHKEWIKSHPGYERKFNKNNPARGKKKWATYRKKKGDALFDMPGQIAKALGLPVEKCTLDLLELKKQQLHTYRLTKQLHQLLKEKQNGTK